MEIQPCTEGRFRVNTCLVTDPATNYSSVVDTRESRALTRRLIEVDPKPETRKILLTRSHLNHAGALAWLLERWDVSTLLSPPDSDRPLFELLPQQGNLGRNADI